MSRMLVACNGQPHDPVNDGLRARRLCQSEESAQNAKNSRHGSETDARRKEELQSDMNKLDLAADGRCLFLVFYLFPLCLIFLISPF